LSIAVYVFLALRQMVLSLGAGMGQSMVDLPLSKLKLLLDG
jgi:hypothetical protein